MPIFARPRLRLEVRGALEKLLVVLFGMVCVACGTRQEPISIAGSYARYVGENASADIELIQQANGLYRLHGFAAWPIEPAHETGYLGIGELTGSFARVGDVIHYKDEWGCELILSFSPGFLVVSGDVGRCGGRNVSFNGEYQKLGDD